MGGWGSDRWALPGAEERKGSRPLSGSGFPSAGHQPRYASVSTCPHSAILPTARATRSRGEGVTHLSNVLPNHCLLFQTSEEGPV